MKERILRLCRRLDSFTLDKISAISEINETDILPVLDELIAEDILIIKNNIYFYINSNSNNPLLNTLNYYPDTIIGLLLKGFCLNLPIITVYHLTDVSENTILKLYKIIRSKIYELQLQELKNQFIKDPQNARCRQFFNKEVYFYIYNNIVYTSEFNLNPLECRAFTECENQEFRKIYSYISRILSHNKNEYYLCHKIAEMLWRRNKSFDEMYFLLKNILFS